MTMDPNPADEAERALCATTARWLHACSGVLGTLAMASAGGAFVLLLASPSPWPALAVLLMVPPERLLALRLRFDAGLFADLAQRTTTCGRLDDALHRLALRRRRPGTRPTAARVDGSRRLVHRHAALAALQFALVAGQAAWPLFTGAAGMAR